MFACDLHTHTTRSDGHLTPAESIDRAAAMGLKVMAITDHDTILPLYEEKDGERINLEKYALDRGVELIRGIEISCDRNNEDVHIIGLFCDWDAPEFSRLEEAVRASRTASYQEILKKLAKAGYRVSWQELLEAAGKTDCPDNVQKKQIFEYLAAKGYVATWQDGKKMLQANPELNAERDKPDPAETIKMLHNTGGTAILAHPYLIREEPVYRGEKMTRLAYLDLLAQAGLDGIEACYTYGKTSYAGSLTKEEIERQVRRHFENTGLFFSGGSDFHGDYKQGIKNPRELGECGVTYEYYCTHIRR